jgi:hypothetical protein
VVEESRANHVVAQEPVDRHLRWQSVQNFGHCTLLS